MSKKKIWLTVALVIVLVTVAYFIYRNRKNTSQNDKPTLTCPDFDSQYEGKPSVSSEGFNIEQEVVIGDYGAEVAYLQERLNTQYGADVSVDGKFGCETWFALQAFTGLDGSKPIDLNDLK
jgi:hypothetical protein